MALLTVLTQEEINALYTNNSLMPTATVNRLQPNTVSATLCLPFSNDNVTSPMAHRRSAQGIKSTKREIKSTVSVDTLFRARVVGFMYASLYFAACKHYKRYFGVYDLPKRPLDALTSLIRQREVFDVMVVINHSVGNRVVD